MANGDNYRSIALSDQLVFNSAGALVGVRSGQSSAAEFRNDLTVVQQAALAPFGVLFRSGVPMILQGAGTVGANGALSAIPVLPRVYTQCYMYFPNGKAYSGSVAGWYYVVMSSTTAGTIYNNRAATEGAPTVPSTLVPIVDAGPGAYTQLTGTTITAISATVKGGSLGPHGGLRVTEITSIANTASNKVTEVYLGGQNFGSFSISTAGYFASRYVTDIGFTGLASQVGTYYNGYGGFGVDLSRGTVNTLVDQALTLTLNIASQTDFNALEAGDVMTFYGA